MAYQITYVSASRSRMDQHMLSDILEVSRENNSRDNITGVLMYHNQIFFQVLEGERSVVDNCFARICDDTRHFGISLMWSGEVKAKSFSVWTMGYAGPVEIDHYTDRSLQSLLDLKSGKDVYPQSDSLALLLARQVYLDFSGFNRFGNTRSIQK